ncbi:adenylyl-sulfate kinase [Parasediminibacterium paludis]|uniref:Adenylyl-sulfate kinase n=1 Tax=Parasediminibacterium paludis TaxID=908966 RepID=A0ABV8PT87_9BACT
MPIFLFTGLSGAGKTTLAVSIKQALALVQLSVEIIDGDVYRQTLCKDLGFSKHDRIENLRRLGEVAINIAPLYDIVIVAAISPFEAARQVLVQNTGAYVVWIQCELEILTDRDTKGLYRKAYLPNNHPEKIANLTGVNDVYEAPLQAHLIVNTSYSSVEESTAIICKYLLNSLQQSVPKPLHSKLPTLHLQ